MAASASSFSEIVKIRIPNCIVQIWDRFGDWANVPIYKLGRWGIRRIDIILVAAGIGCTSYYWWIMGWLGALQGAMLYVAGALMAIWIF